MPPTDKFQKTLDEIETDLDKLLYTMKMTDTATKNARLPDFMREGWLEETLKELDKANMTPEQRADLEMTIAGNMSEKAAMEEQIEREAEKARNEIEKVKRESEKAKRESEKAKEETIVKMVRKGYDADEIAEITNVPLTIIRAIERKVSSQ